MLCCLLLSQPSSAQTSSKQQGTAEQAHPLYEFTILNKQKQEQTLQATQVVETRDGGVLMLTRDGRMLNVPPQQLKQRRQLDKIFTPLGESELEQQLTEELGPGFTFTRTKHFILCSQADKRYSQWCGSLFERLYKVMRNYWDSNELLLHEPQVPLIAIIFKDRAAFAAYASQHVKKDVTDLHGYYSSQSNRIVLYDLTAASNGQPASADADILVKIRKSPSSIVSVLHECTHQIAFNIGLHTRYADNPLWLTEGIATFFETPNLNSKADWQTVGRPNSLRIKQFVDYARSRRKADSLQTLISSNQRFQNQETLLDAYAEAWAFSYFLIKTRRRDYEKYLKLIADRKPLIKVTSEEQLKAFQTVFGNDLMLLDQQFLNYIREIAN
ncbi:DUF1570 domain-containing protein [Gimesia chilikensis]|uniref:DUF1570 domain-containing protein n=1 Tax=Gimesia chilikensis TaxID=2605989 RepID=UPI001659D31C|nr:DUF1570 domain-containing protein [Gimesia chilikensis]